ncbi:MAG TPA: antitoxin VapB family protein [Vicinamibacterales bacterium]|nr:antitoxin VapB family protein [Vicinamibacterales bacterium]
MAVKTITIDMEAYEALARRKGPGESFSDVIKRQFRGGTGADLLRAAQRANISDETLDAVERQIKLRRRDRPRIPKL